MKDILLYARTHWRILAETTALIWLLALRVYYWTKPWIPYLARRTMRRFIARKVRASSKNVWPIMESAGVIPDGWPGWPAGEKFAFILTHDVESQKGVDRVKQLAELEMALGFRSSFNFIPEGPYQVSKELREWLVERGFEVGVHDHRHDGKLYQSRARFVDSAVRINHFLKEWNAVGFRAGFMFRNLEWLQDLEIAYDASTFDTDPFEPQSDGANTIYPFWVPAKEGGGYMELPYTLVQDSTLFVLLQEKTEAIWRQKTSWIAAHGGMALLNVHPDYTALEGREPAADEFPVSHYTNFLSWVKENYHGQIWHALPKKVAEYSRRQAHHIVPVLIFLHADSVTGFLTAAA